MLCSLLVMKTQNKNRNQKSNSTKKKKDENQIKLTSLSKFHSDDSHSMCNTKIFSYLFIKFNYDRSSSVCSRLHLTIWTNQANISYRTKNVYVHRRNIFIHFDTVGYTRPEFECTSIHMEHQTVTERGKSMRERIQHSDTLNFELVYFRFSST